MHGFGIGTWPNGDRYEGDWVNGQRTGQGKYFYSSGGFLATHYHSSLNLTVASVFVLYNDSSYNNNTKTLAKKSSKH